MEPPPSMDPTKTLTHYKQKISAKKSVLAPAKITLTELTLAEYDAAVRDPMPASARPRVDRSRSPHLTMARRAPLETVREQLNVMQQGELLQIMALCSALIFTTNITPQSTLLHTKAALQREVLQRPWTEWASVMAPFIAEWRADPRFDERDLARKRHSDSDNLLMSPNYSDAFEEAVEFLINWPPREGRAGIFKETRCCQLDPRIVARTWFKSGPLCHAVCRKECPRGVARGLLRHSSVHRL